MNRRLRILLLLLAVLLAGLAAWAWQDLSASRQAAEAAWADLAACRSAADKIRAYRRRPTLATDTERLESETRRLIEEAAKKAEIPVEDQQRISLEPSRRIGDTVYREKPTQVLLRKVTLRQVAALVYDLVAGEAGFTARSLHLSAPREADGGNTWTVDLVVTYLIYDPQRPAK
jgi:hypothetical protein